MSGLVGLTVATCLLYGLLHALPAQAAGGRITFSGAVMVPTCAEEPASTMAPTLNTPSDRAFNCGARPQAASLADASIYRRSVVSLDGASAVHGQLLQYFVGYRASMHAAGTQMVTRTYE